MCIKLKFPIKQIKQYHMSLLQMMMLGYGIEDSVMPIWDNYLNYLKVILFMVYQKLISKRTDYVMLVNMESK